MEFPRHKFLHDLVRHAGSVERAAKAINMQPKTFRRRLALTEEELQRTAINLEEWRIAAEEFNIPLGEADKPRPLWDAHLSYVENRALTPPTLPHIPPLPDLHVPFLGYDLMSCFGAGAGVVSADSGRAEYLFYANCAVVTLKTVRSRFYPALPPPNLLYCAADTPFVDPDHLPEKVIVGDTGDGHMAHAGTVNQFRIPSLGPEQLLIDLRRARKAAAANQLLITSVVGTSDRGDASEIADDFVRTVQIGVNAGIDVFELNFSCPTDTAVSEIITVPGLPERIATAVRAAARSVKLLIKLPYLDAKAYEAVILDTAAYVDGYTAINSLPVKAMRNAGPHGVVPAFSAGEYAGLAGRPILECGLRAARELVAIRSRNHLTSKVIIGMGGVTAPADVISYRELGVDLVQAVSIFHEDPLFAVKVHEELARHERQERRGRDADLETVWHNLGAAVRALEKRGFDGRKVAAAASQRYSELRDEYAQMGASPRRSRIRSVAELVRDLEYRVRSSRSPQ